MTQPSAKTFSLYAHGARRGLSLGLYLSALCIVCFMAYRIPLGGIIGLFMMAAVPFLAYRGQKSAITAAGTELPTSSVWLVGIISFIGAAIVAGAAITVYLRWIEPDYIANQLTMAATIFSQSTSPDLQEMSSTLQTLIDSNNIPTAIDMAASLMWFITFSGIILSGILAVVVKATSRPSRR